MRNHKITKKALINLAMLWLVVFCFLMFLYGHFGFRTCADYFSRQYLLLTIVPPVMILVMLWNCKEDILDILCKVAMVIIPTFFVTVPLYDEYIVDWFNGEFSRLGSTPAGTAIDTGRIYLLMMIPLLYKVIIDKEIKRYLWAILIALAGIVITGSKAALFPVIVVVAILFMGAAKCSA